MRAIDLADAPERYVGKTVTVDIVEHLMNGTEGIRVDIPEHGAMRLTLVRDASLGSERIESPIRVRGELERRFPSGLLEKANNCCFVIRASSIEPLVLPPAVPAPAIDAILADRPRWDRRPVIYEGVWAYGWEWSLLDLRISLDLRIDAAQAARNANLPRPPHGKGSEVRVRVTGILFSHGNLGYGHLNARPLGLLASKLEVLDVPDAGVAPLQH